MKRTIPQSPDKPTKPTWASKISSLFTLFYTTPVPPAEVERVLDNSQKLHEEVQRNINATRVLLEESDAELKKPSVLLNQ